MLEVIVLVFGIYMSLVAAAVTVLVLASSGWYINKCKKMTKKMMEEFDDEVV